VLWGVWSAFDTDQDGLLGSFFRATWSKPEFVRMIWALPRPPCRAKTNGRVLLSIGALTTIARRVCQDVGERRYCWSTSRLDRLRRPFEESPLRVDGVSLRNPVVNTCTIWISAGVQSSASRTANRYSSIAIVKRILSIARRSTSPY
jgi:hypothetical protein